MKLYTEEQIVNATNKVFIEATTFEDVNEIVRKLTHIELPSDEEITHLQWIYDRMSKVHSENENYDYMLKFKEIIEQLKKGGNK